MPTFDYKAKSSPGKSVEGKIEAESQQDAINKISKMGYFPVSVKMQDELNKAGGLQLRKVANKDLVMLTRQLSTLTGSGVNIITGLNIVFTQTSNKQLKAILSDVTSRIKDGKSLSESLSAHPHLFSSLYSSMIHTGEASGNLNTVLARLADHLEKHEEFRNSLRASLTYPLFVLGVGVLTVLTLLIFVVPRLVVMFEDMGQALPLPTMILINVSGFLKDNWWMIAIVIGVIAFILRRLFKDPQARTSLDRMKLKLPVFGAIILKSEITRLTRTLSLLISSGIPISQALEVSVSIVDNQILKTEIKKIKDKIAEGGNFSTSLKETKLFPDFVTNIVAIGEESGSLEKSLLRVSEDYEREIDRSIKTMMRLLEPVIILAMGLIVGFIVLSMLLPIFQINLIAK